MSTQNLQSTRLFVRNQLSLPENEQEWSAEQKTAFMRALSARILMFPHLYDEVTLANARKYSGYTAPTKAEGLGFGEAVGIFTDEFLKQADEKLSIVGITGRNILYIAAGVGGIFLAVYLINRLPSVAKK